MRLHSLERSPLFTEILDFLYPGKKPGRLTQPTHGVPPKIHFPFSAQSKGRVKNWFFFFFWFFFCFVLFYCAQSLHVFPRFRQFPCFLSEFSLAPCDSFLVSDLTWWCFLWWFHNTLEKSTLMEFFFIFWSSASQRWVRTAAQKGCIRRVVLSE